MRALLLTLPLFAACGGGTESAGLPVALRMNALPCERDIQGLQAKLDVPGHETCPLVVSSDRTVAGTCFQITTGRAYEVRLAYFVQLSDVDSVEIARIYQTIDLTSPSDAVVDVQFPDSKLETDIDDDGDQQTNIAEVCAGRDPKRAGE